MTMTFHAGSHHASIKRVESSKQRSGSIPLVIVGHRLGAALLHGQAGLGTVQSLDLALLVERKHQRMFGRIQIESDDIFQLLGKTGIVAQLEGFYAVRFQAMTVPDAAY